MSSTPESDKPEAEDATHPHPKPRGKSHPAIVIPAVTSQPKSGNSGKSTKSRNKKKKKPFSATNPDVPGLEHLHNVDGFFLKRKVELREIILNWESHNKYAIFDHHSQLVCYAAEDAHWAVHQCCGEDRSTIFHIIDENGRELLRLERSAMGGNCFCLCCPCCPQYMEIYTYDGYLLGKVEQEWSFTVAKFVVKNGIGKHLFRIQSPPCMSFSCGANVVFDILSVDGKRRVGKIAKKSSATGRDAIDGEHLGIEFPKSLDISMKATMIGVCMLLDFMFYEHHDHG